ncbi:MAG: hypothetical protein WKI04_18600 [Ferruginibacter sp.]
MPTFKHIAPFLSSGENRLSRWVAFIGLGAGVVLLLSSIQMYININGLLNEKNSRKEGADFISVTKRITNDNMGMDNRFTTDDISEIKAQPFIEDAAPLISNQFRVKASAGNIIPFSTDLFLESLDEKFLDTVPPSFSWKEGQADVPIIFSSDFMEMYNVFAPSQDLPQLSDKTMSSVNVILECYTPYGVKNYRARIVALSDRINSVLVPNNFMQWANKNFGGADQVKPSRIYIKTVDANSPQLISFLEKKDYRVNKDKTKFGRVKQILEAIISGLAGFGVLVILLAMLLFSFYLQLMIAKSKDNLQLLLTLGYSPAWLSKTVAKKWIPVYINIITAAVLLTALLQFTFQRFLMYGRGELSPMIHWTVIATAIILLALSVFTNYRLIKKLLYKLG